MNLAEVIAELRKLNEPVPQPLRLPTVAEVDLAEQRLGVRFHPDYRKYLLEASDVVYGPLEPGTIVPGGGHTDLFENAKDAWEVWGLSKALLPICHDNANYYCMNAEGEIVYWTHDGYTNEKWPDLATWIKRVWIEGE